MKHAITIDVEDYFQVSAMEGSVNRNQWGKLESRVERNTAKILDIFEENGIKGTFFILGWVAHRYPNIVKEIHQRGHEIASHGYSHELVYRQSPEIFREETIRSKSLLEDITGEKILGYRAASFSITDKSIWALDILAEEGFEYDSSLYPVRHDRYGMSAIEPRPHKLETPNRNSLVELPLTTLNIFGYRLPISGGGYFRLYPYLMSRMGLGHAARQLKSPFVFYLHPWEIDPEQPVMINKRGLSRFRHYNNLGKCEQRLRCLLKDFQFCSAREMLKSEGLLA